MKALQNAYGLNYLVGMYLAAGAVFVATSGAMAAGNVPVWVVVPNEGADVEKLAETDARAVVVPPELIADGSGGFCGRLEEEWKEHKRKCLGLLPLDRAPYGPQGSDLLATHPQWRLCDGADRPVAGRANPAAGKLRSAIVQFATRHAGSVDGYIVSCVPPDPVEGRPAWSESYCQTLLDRYRARYGTDARKFDEGAMGHLLYVKLTAAPVTELFTELADAVDVPLYVAMARSDTYPESAAWRYIDLHRLLIDELVDGVFLSGDDGLDLRRPRLHTDRSILAGIACRSEAGQAAMTVMRSRNADAVLSMPSGDAVAWLDKYHQAFAGLQRAQQARRRLTAAVQEGDLSIAAGIEPEADMDVATIHGVAQSFRLRKPAMVVGVGLNCILRGQGALGQKDLRVTIRRDADGEPDPQSTIAEGQIPAVAYAEPGWTWGYAPIEQPVKLAADKTYWLHAADTTRKGNSYVWRITRDGTKYPRGHAWSKTYDYSDYDWVFRILVRGSDGP